MLICRRCLTAVDSVCDADYTLSVSIKQSGVELETNLSVMIDTSSAWFILTLAEIPFFLAGLIGNVLVIRIVHKTRDMHTTTNYLLANLAFSDVIAMLLVWPVMLILSSGYEKFSCKFSVVCTLPVLVSSFTLTVLAVERYHALLKPFRTGLRLKEDNIKKAIAVIWISSVAICLPGFFLSEWSEIYSYCISNKVYFIIILVVLAYIPMIVFLYCYGSLIEGLYFSHTICTENTNEDRNSEKKKLVITFILATAGFVIGYGPTCIFYTVAILGGERKTAGFKFSNQLAVVESIFFCSLCLNPILYAFRSTNFREGFKRIIFCRESPPQIDMEMS